MTADTSPSNSARAHADACQPGITTTVVVKPPFQVSLSGTVYGPGEVVEAPDEVAARIQREASTGCYASTSPRAPTCAHELVGQGW